METTAKPAPTMTAAEVAETLKRLGRKLQRVGLHLAETRKKLRKVEGERDALRERCEKLEWLVEVQEFVVYFDPTSTLDNACVELAASWKYAELCAALATEVKP